MLDDPICFNCTTFWDSEGYDWSHFIGYRWDMTPETIDTGEIRLFFVDATRGIYRLVDLDIFDVSVITF